MTIKNIVGIIGWPIKHSISPAIQNRAFKEANLFSWSYVPMPVKKHPAISLKEGVFGIRALGFLGANITVPYKEAVLPYLDHISDTAKKILAVNTIVIDKDFSISGHNTDVNGFLYDLADHQIEPANMRCLLLGAGGSARAITYGLLRSGCNSLTILNRTKTKAENLARSFSQLFLKANIQALTLNTDAMKKIPDFDLIINATSLGLADTAHLMPWDRDIKFLKNQIVYDIIYNPKMTTFLKHAKNCSAKTINGLGMLVHQGALSFEVWTGKKAPISAMKEEAIQHLRER